MDIGLQGICFYRHSERSEESSFKNQTNFWIFRYAQNDGTEMVLTLNPLCRAFGLSADG